jgi:hypothetical protein
LEIFLDTLDTKVDFLCLTEHWVPRNNEQGVVISDFTLAATYGREFKSGGGSCIYVRNCPTTNTTRAFKTVPNLQPKESIFEICAIEITTEPAFTLASVYRTPDQASLENFLDELHKLLNRFSKGNKKLVVCGDMNIDILDPSLLSKLDEVTSAYGFSIRNIGPTRVTPNSQTAIDLVITNWEEAHLLLNVDPGLSDHHGQLIQLPRNKITAPMKIPIRLGRSFKESEILAFSLELSEVNWGPVFASTTTNNKYDAFLRSFIPLFEKHFPKKPKGNSVGHSSKGWITPSIRSTCQAKRELNHLVTHGASTQIKSALAKLKKELSVEISLEQMNFNSRAIRNALNKATALSIERQ